MKRIAPVLNSGRARKRQRPTEPPCSCNTCATVAQVAVETRDLPTKSTYRLLSLLQCEQTARSYRHALRPLIQQQDPTLLLLDEDSQGDESTDDPSSPVLPQQAPPLSPSFLLEEQDWIPPSSDIEAWRNPIYWPRIRRRFSEVRHSPPHPCSSYVRTDFELDPTTGKRKHDYYIHDKLATEEEGSYTPTGIIALLWDKFDREYQSKQSEGGKNPKYKGKNKEEIKAVWEGNAEHGTQCHNSAEYLLFQHDRELPPEITPLPPGFYRMLADLFEQGYDVVWTETAIAHVQSKARGESDLTLRERSTGKLVQADFKFCDCDDFFDETKGSTKETGRHPTTVHLRASKGNKYTFQVSYYLEIQRRECPQLDFADYILLLNMNPTNPDNYRIYKQPAMDLSKFWTYLPWRMDDPRHQHFEGTTLVPRSLLSGAEGATKRVAVSLGDIVRNGLPGDAVWCGRAWMSKDRKQEAAKRKAAIATRNKVVEKLKQRNKPLPVFYENTPLPSPDEIVPELPASEWKHPWYWFKKRPIGAYGYYEWWLLNQPALIQQIPALYGKTLLCWCPDGDPQCHANVLAKYANLWKQGVWQVPDMLAADAGF